MTFIYSRHSSYEKAELALEEYFATGEVFESELIGIKRINGKFCIVLKG